MGPLLKLVGLLSTALGPFLSWSEWAPRMPPDLRPMATWLSFIAALGAWALAMWVLRKRTPAMPPAPNAAWVIGPGLVVAFLCALGYAAITVSFTRGSGSWTDQGGRIAALAVYCLSCAGLTAALAAAAKGSGD